MGFLRDRLKYETEEARYISLMGLDIVMIFFSTISMIISLGNGKPYWTFIIIGIYCLMRLVRNSIYLGIEYEKQNKSKKKLKKGEKV